MFDLPEIITVYNETGGDGFGGKSYSRDEYPARIALRNEQMTDENGDNFMSKAIVYSRGADLDVTSIVYLGATAAVSPPADADDVRMLTQTPSGAGTLKRAVL